LAKPDGAGLAAAAARGRKGGRKPVIDTEKLARARSMIAKGLTGREAASRLRVGKTALYEALRPGAREIKLAEVSASSAI
jgi:DNA invertase Pin-like site-specific DNA recombinase